jgi:CRISPR/Cas system-associated exonuclease Cas4 (RecB family)
MNEPRPFNWTIAEQGSWPPRKRPRPPFSVTAVEVLRSCALRVCFEASPGYERRTGFAARVGTAFHKTLEQLSSAPLYGSAADAGAHARDLFLAALAEQERQAAARPREQTLSREETRVERALEAVVIEAQRLARSADTPIRELATPMLDTAVSRDIPVQVEVLVRSRDGLLHGRIDRVERMSGGVRLVDYKSALRPDLPERYERQLQLYAAMWHDAADEWPVDGLVVYPLTATQHRVAVDPVVCEQVVQDAARGIARVLSARATEALATPGDVCKVCEFRPWCRAFWESQARDTHPSSALQQAAMGFEGEVIERQQVDRHWRLRVAWREAIVTLLAEVERFPHLQQAAAGTRIRALDWRLHGLRHQPQATVTPLAEIFLVASST